MVTKSPIAMRQANANPRTMATIPLAESLGGQRLKVNSSLERWRNNEGKRDHPLFTDGSSRIKSVIFKEAFLTKVTHVHVRSFG